MCSYGVTPRKLRVVETEGIVLSVCEEDALACMAESACLYAKALKVQMHMSKMMLLYLGHSFRFFWWGGGMHIYIQATRAGPCRQRACIKHLEG